MLSLRPALYRLRTIALGVSGAQSNPDRPTNQARLITDPSWPEGATKAPTCNVHGCGYMYSRVILLHRTYMRKMHKKWEKKRTANADASVSCPSAEWDGMETPCGTGAPFDAAVAMTAHGISGTSSGEFAEGVRARGSGPEYLRAERRPVSALVSA